MKNTMWKAVLGVGLLVPLAACDDNPLDSEIGDVAQLTFDRSYVTVLPNDSTQVIVTPASVYGDPVQGTNLDFTPCASGVALTVTEVPDNDEDTENGVLSGQQAIMIHSGNALGLGCIVASGGGQTDTVRVLVVPDFLPTLEATAVGGGTVTLLRAIGQPAFDDDVEVHVNGAQTYVYSTLSSEDTLVFFVPVGTEVGVAEIVVDSVGEGQATIPASIEITAEGTDVDEPNEWLLGGGADEVTAVELPLEYIGTIGDPDLDDFLEFTIAEESTIDFFLDWAGESGDLDFIVYTPAGASAACNSATAAHPEHTECTLAAGTYVMRVNNYDEAGATTYYLNAHFVE